MDEMYQELREARSAARRTHGVPRPDCVRLLPKANPSILLPGQQCRMHKYTDPRQRDAGNSYLIETRRGSS